MISKALDSHFLEHRHKWKKCIGMCKNSASNMTGRLSGVVVKVGNASHPDILSTHCTIHREHPVAKNISLGLHKV